MNSGNNLDGSSPRKVLLEQLQRILPADDSLPDQVMNSSLITDSSLSSVRNVYLSISLLSLLKSTLTVLRIFSFISSILLPTYISS